jgi:hypothetical protein
MNASPSSAPVEPVNTSRMAKVIDRTKQLRLLFEMEREFARVVSALVPPPAAWRRSF